jgi:hypothetical protein
MLLKKQDEEESAVNNYFDGRGCINNPHGYQIMCRFSKGLIYRWFTQLEEEGESQYQTARWLSFAYRSDVM